MRYQGKIKSWSDEKGEGKVKSESLRKRIWIDMSSFNDLNYHPQEGDIISFVIETREDGKLQAEQAELVLPMFQGRPNQKAPQPAPNIAREWHEAETLMRKKTAPEPPNPEHYKRALSLLWSVILLGALIIGSVVYWEKWQQNRQAQQNKIIVDEVAKKMQKENKALEERYRHPQATPPKQPKP